MLVAPFQLARAALLRTRVVPEGTEPAQWVQVYRTMAVAIIAELDDPDQRLKAVRDVARALAVASGGSGTPAGSGMTLVMSVFHRSSVPMRWPVVHTTSGSVGSLAAPA